MKIADRRQIVARLLSEAQSEALKEAEAVKKEAGATRDFISGHVRNYVLFKFLLEPDCAEEDIKELAKLSLAKTTKIDPKIIRELDQATPCDQATSESAKKVLLLYAVQKDFGLQPDPEKLSNVETLGELSSYVYEALQKAKQGCADAVQSVGA